MRRTITLTGCLQHHVDPPNGAWQPQRGTSGGWQALSDHLVHPEEEQRRDGEAERPGGLQVDHQLELRRLLDRQVPRLRPPKDLVYEARRAVVQVRIAGL